MMDEREKISRREELLLRAGWITVLLETYPPENYFSHGLSRRLSPPLHRRQWFIIDKLITKTEDGDWLLCNNKGNPDENLGKMVDHWFKSMRFRKSIEAEPGQIDFKKTFSLCRKVHELVEKADISLDKVGRWMDEEIKKTRNKSL